MCALAKAHVGQAVRRLSALVLTLSLLLSLAPSSALAAMGWNMSGGRWWYQSGAAYESYARDGWYLIDGVWYFFDAEGWMRTGWIRGAGENDWYLCDHTGAMVHSRWVEHGGAWYYLLPSGLMATNAWIGSSYVGEDGRWLPDGPPAPNGLVIDPAPAPKPDQGATDTAGATDANAIVANSVERLTVPGTWDEAQAPEYYLAVGKAAVRDVPAVGTVVYDGLDELGRTRGVRALLTKQMADAGAARPRGSLEDYSPSGWGSNRIVDIELSYGKSYHGYFWNRSHLLAKALGGRDSTDNLITGTRMQNVGSNDGIYGVGGMAHTENLARDWLASNPEGTLYYAATPLYRGSELVPRSVVVDLRSSDGSIDVEVEVYNAAKGYEISYAHGSFAAAPKSTDEPEPEPEPTDHQQASGPGKASQGGTGSGGSSSAGDATKPSAPSADTGATTHESQTGDGYKHAPLPGTFIVTKSGKKYHRSENCPGLRRADWSKVRYIDQARAQAEGFSPCSKCM